MATLTRFAPDPEAPGYGTAEFDDGSALYVDQAMAEEILGASMPGEPDERIAGPAYGLDIRTQSPGGDAVVTDTVDESSLNRPIRDTSPSAMQNERSLQNLGVNVSGGVVDDIDVAKMHAQRQAKANARPPDQAPGGGVPGGAGAGGSGGGPGGQLPRAPISPYKYVGGSAGVDPYRMREQGVPVPETVSTVTTSGPQYDPEMAAQRVAAAKDLQQAKTDVVSTQAMRLEAEAQQQAAEAAEQQKLAEARQAEIQKMEQRYQEERARLQQDIDEWNTSQKPDPNRIFGGRDTWAHIGAAIAQAIGAYGATLAGTRNFASDIINRAIDRDLEIQEQEIKQGRATRANKLARLHDEMGGDLAKAKAALKMLQQNAAKNLAESYSKEVQREDLLANADVMLSEMQQEMLKTEQEYYNQSMGEQVTTVSQKVVQPQAPTRARRVPKSSREIKEERDRYYLENYGVTFEEASDAVKDAAKGNEQLQDNVVEYGKKRAELEATDRALEQIEKSLSTQAEQGGVPGVGLIRGDRSLHAIGSFVGLDHSEQALKNIQDIQTAVNKAVEANKGAASEGDVQRYAEQVTGAGSVEEVLRGIRSMRDKTRIGIEALGSTYGPDAESLWLQNQRRLRQQRARTQPQLEPLE